MTSFLAERRARLDGMGNFGRLAAVGLLNDGDELRRVRRPRR